MIHYTWPVMWPALGDDTYDSFIFCEKLYIQLL